MTAKESSDMRKMLARIEELKSQRNYFLGSWFLTLLVAIVAIIL